MQLSALIEIWPQLDEFLDSLQKLETLSDKRQLLEVFLSDSELQNLAQRWLLTQLLLAGKSRKEVGEKTGAASITVGRAAKTVKKLPIFHAAIR